jgi:flavin-dependent dehydrogenase
VTERISRGITVIGSGPSGLTAAITLAQAGVPVTVYEKNPIVGARFHGDFQGLENWSREQDVLSDLRTMGLEINFTTDPRYAADFYDAFGQLHRVAMKEPFFYLVRRRDAEGSLDSGLYAQALEAGVQLCFNRKLDQIEGPAIVATGPRYADGI